MSQDVYVGAYWGPRQESIDGCADRLGRFFQDIARCDSVFKHWYDQGRSRKDALKRPIDVHSRDVVFQLLEKGRHRRALDRSLVEDMGFMIGLWNGQPDEKSLSLNVSCGMFADSSNLSNAVVLDLPEDLEKLADTNRLATLLEIMARVWDPEWAGVISRASREARGWKGGSPFVDWMLYLNRTGMDQTKLPPGASAKVIDNRGTILVVQEQPIDSSNPKDMANVNAVAAIAGLKV
jgi:hypothetical protein